MLKIHRFNSPGVLQGSINHLKQRKESISTLENFDIRDHQQNEPSPQTKATANPPKSRTPPKKQKGDSDSVTISGQAAKQGKPRRWIDPSPNAQRVSPDSDQHPPPMPDDDENSGEESHQQDRRAIATASRRALAPSNKRQTSSAVAGHAPGEISSKRKSRQSPTDPNIADDDDVGGAVPTVPRTTSKGKLRQAPQRDSETVGGADGSHDDTAPNNNNEGDQEPHPTPIENYKMARKAAKKTTADRTKKKVQTRKQWTDYETETLINLIQDHGTSWKYLKDRDEEKGKVLVNRDQTALKDKARNIKFDYLK